MKSYSVKYLIPSLALLAFAKPCTANAAEASPASADAPASNDGASPAASSPSNAAATDAYSEVESSSVRAELPASDQQDPANQDAASQDATSQDATSQDAASHDTKSESAAMASAETATVSDQPVAGQSTEPKTHGFTFEGGMGVALPFGSVASDAEPLDSIVTALLTAHVTMGYRFGHLWLGGSALGGAGPTSEEGDLSPCGRDDVECTNALVRVTANARYFPTPGAQIEPFVGLGAGYEWFGSTVEVDGEKIAGIRARGLSLVSVEAGAQFWHRRSSAFNAFLSYSAGEYAHRELAAFGESMSESIPGGVRELHHWVALNLSGVLMP